MTLSTSVVENLNILNVVTADRVVAQVSTEHPREGYIPTITFLGSQFVNLRLAGQLVEVELDWDILANYPGGRTPVTDHKDFCDCLTKRLALIRESASAPADLKKDYEKNSTPLDGGGVKRRSLAGEVDQGISVSGQGVRARGGYSALWPGIPGDGDHRTHGRERRYIRADRGGPEDGGCADGLRSQRPRAGGYEQDERRHHAGRRLAQGGLRLRHI